MSVELPASYFVRVAGQQVGPLSLMQVHDLLKSGTITADSQAIGDGMHQWVRVGDLLAGYAKLAKNDAVPPPAPFGAALEYHSVKRVRNLVRVIAVIVFAVVLAAVKIARTHKTQKPVQRPRSTLLKSSR